MSNFLEERVEYDDILIGATYTEDYNVEITKTSGGQEYRRLIHGLPMRSFVLTYNMSQADIWNKVLSLYHRCYGMFSGFRMKTRDDYTTNGWIDPPTPFDQVLKPLTANTFQLQKAYGVGGATELAIGLPIRTIFKPVPGTVRIGASGVELTTGWSVNTTTGVVSFTSKSKVVTNITNSSSAVVTVDNHTFVAGESVVFMDVIGMVQINGLRVRILSVTSTTITVNVDTTTFSAYGIGGSVDTRPSPFETVLAGCEFDIPARFNSKVDILHTDFLYRGTSSIDVIELLNP